MATSPSKFSTFTFILCVALVLSSTNELVSVEGLCERGSTTFTGPCFDSSLCDIKCKGEGAVEGACHQHGLGFACRCYFNC